VAGAAGAELGADDAIADLSRVTELRPDDAAAWNALADAHAMDGDNEQAAAAFAKAAELAPESEESLAAAGAAAFAAGDGETAISSLVGAADMVGGASSAAINLVDVYRELGRHADALAMARRILEAIPDDRLALLDVAELELEAGTPEASATAFAKLVAMSDDPAEAAATRHGLIDAQLAGGDAAAAGPQPPKR